MKNRQEIYKELFHSFYEWVMEHPHLVNRNFKLTLEDVATRKANIYAVQNTEWTYQNQFKKGK